MFELESVEKTNENLGKINATKRAFKKSLKSENRFQITKDNLKDYIPSENEYTFIKTNGLSDVSNILQILCENEKPEELYISTWIINKQNIDFIVNLDCQVKHIVISNRLKQLKKSDYNYLLLEFNKIENLNCKLRICNSHAKIFSLKTSQNYYTCIGSGNFTENPRIEVYMIHNDKELFEINKNWIVDMTK